MNWIEQRLNVFQTLNVAEALDDKESKYSCRRTYICVFKLL